MKTILAVVAGVLLFVTANSYADEISKSMKIKELMKVEGVYDTIERQKKAGEEQARILNEQITKEIKAKFGDLGPAFLTSFEKTYQCFLEESKSPFTTDEAVNAFGELYGAELSESDVDQILAFYKSPVGMKDIQASNNSIPKWTKVLADKTSVVYEKAMQKYMASVRKLVDTEIRNTRSRF